MFEKLKKFLEKEDMESYIFGIKTMMDDAMPKNLQSIFKKQGVSE